MPLKPPSILKMVMGQLEQEAPQPTPSTEPDPVASASDDDNDMGNVSAQIEEFDKEQIKVGLNSIDELKEVVNARGDLFMTVNGVRGYKVALQYADSMPQVPEMNKQQNTKKRLEECFMFIYSDANPRVIEFLVSTAQSNNFKKILGFTENAVIVTEYRL